MSEQQRWTLVKDNSCHRYYIPFDKIKEWYEWTEMDEDNPASWEEPEYAHSVDGGYLTFTDPRIEKGP